MRTSSWGPSTIRYGIVSIEVRTAADPHLRPIKRFAAKTVFSAFVIACRLAMCPTSRLPFSAMATIDGVVLYPPRFGITTGVPSSTIATHEFVVPRSIPITFSDAMSLYCQRVARTWPVLGDPIGPPRSDSPPTSGFARPRRGTHVGTLAAGEPANLGEVGP